MVCHKVTHLLNFYLKYSKDDQWVVTTFNTINFEKLYSKGNIFFIKASEARLVVEFFAIGTGAQGYRLLTRNAPLSEKTP